MLVIDVNIVQSKPFSKKFPEKYMSEQMFLHIVQKVRFKKLNE